MAQLYVDVEEQPGAHAQDSCWANFGDERIEITDITVEELREMNQLEKGRPGRLWSGIETATNNNVWIMQSKSGQGKALYIFRDDDTNKYGKAQILQYVPSPDDEEAFDIDHMKKIAEMICSGEVEDSRQARRRGARLAMLSWSRSAQQRQRRSQLDNARRQHTMGHTVSQTQRARTRPRTSTPRRGTTSSVTTTLVTTSVRT